MHPLTYDNSWAYRLIDLILPFLLLALSINLYGVEWHDRYVLLGMLGGFVFISSAQTIGLYQSIHSRSLINSFQIIVNGWLITWALLIISAFLVKDSSNFSRVVLVVWVFLTPVSLIIYRMIFRQLLTHYKSRDENLRKIVIVGHTDTGRQLSTTLMNSRNLGIKFLGFYDDKDNKSESVPNIMGATHAVYDDAQQNKFDEVYICLTLNDEDKIKALLNQLADTTVSVKYVPDLFSFDLMHTKWIDLKGIPVFSVFDSPLNHTTAKFIKRAEDITLSCIILTIISPIMLCLAAGIKLTSSGPIFYRQTRVGWNGKNFEMLKFRTMPVDVEKNGVEWGSAQNKTNTKFGQFIRATSLDELPQFLNVLKGDMSIVGPRPERDVFVDQFRKEVPRYMQKHMVKAGITGWAQINGWRGDTSLDKRIEFDLHYINNWSPWLDIKIIILTVFKGFINKNAY